MADWHNPTSQYLSLKEFFAPVDSTGKYSWETFYNEEEERIRPRDHFVDFKQLLDWGWINKTTFDLIYSKEQDHPIIYLDRDLDTYLFHEDVKERLPSDHNLQRASVASGTYSIGSGLDYDTVTLFEADIAATLTGNLTGEINAEEISESSLITFNVDTDTYALTLTSEDGDEHSGVWNTNKARINFVFGDGIKGNESTADTLNNFIISKLQIDDEGNNYGLTMQNGGDSGPFVIDRCLVRGDSNSYRGIKAGFTAANAQIRNCIVYGLSNYEGLNVGKPNSGVAQTIYNNTIISCSVGIYQANGNAWPGSLTLKNNLCYGNTTDYSDNGGGWGTTAKNVSKDATSPDTSYRNWDPDSPSTPSCFTDYAGKDFTLDETESTLDDGDDLSGTFSDDIEGQTRSTWFIGASEYVAGGTTYTLDAAGGACIISGQAVSLLKGSRLSAEAGSFALTGMAADLLYDRILSAAAGTLTITGQSAGLILARILSAAGGAYVKTGQSAGLLKNSLIDAESGVYSLTGQAADLIYARIMAASAGSYTLTGQDATLLYSQGAVITAEAGSYVITGSAAALKYNRIMSAAGGVLTLTGQDCALLISHLLAADSGNLTITGTAAAFLLDYLLAAADGSLALTGQDVTLTYSGELIPAGAVTITFAIKKPTITYTAKKPSITFTAN